ncbi:MAG: hypothetical protein N2312_06455 [Dictyoglomaceae bacterium]|nr:hypothetical protein [Dictyoglomaceae bacterium]
MKGIRKYTHIERENIIRELVPLIKARFGDNLIALAVSGSFARNEDYYYSDIELIAFLKEMPKDKEGNGISKIYDGLLIDLTWTTKENYIKNIKDVSEDWHLSGSDYLYPIINEEFINELNNYKVDNLKEKCLNRAMKQWKDVQESTSKVLNSILQKNYEGIPLLVYDMLLNMLIVLSLLNQTSYTTFSKVIKEAKTFLIKPKSFIELLDFFTEGKYKDLNKLEDIILRTFSEFEEIFENLGCKLYENLRELKNFLLEDEI